MFCWVDVYEHFCLDHGLPIRSEHPRAGIVQPGKFMLPTVFLSAFEANQDDRHKAYSAAGVPKKQHHVP